MENSYLAFVYTILLSLIKLSLQTLGNRNYVFTVFFLSYHLFTWFFIIFIDEYFNEKPIKLNTVNIRENYEKYINLFRLTIDLINTRNYFQLKAYVDIDMNYVCLLYENTFEGTYWEFLCSNWAFALLRLNAH